MKSKLNNKAQITIFVIIGIVLVVLIVLLFILLNKGTPKPNITVEDDPEGFLEQCINEHVEEAVEKILLIGGYTEVPELTTDFSFPKGYYKQGRYEDVPYLCYAPINYARCVVVEPVIVDHLENEVSEYVENEIKKCFSEFERALKEEQYSTRFGDELNYEVELIPGEVRISMEKEVEIRKSAEPVKFTEFESSYGTTLYGIAVVVQEIIHQESLYCNSDYDDIMRSNTWVKINKFQTGDDKKIYEVTDLRNDNIFRFAIRNCVQDTPK